MPATSDEQRRATIVAVCRLPIELRNSTEWPGLSQTDMVRRSGYATHRASISERDIVAYLHDEPSIINDWVRFSEDQRCNPALCLLPPDQEPGSWKVVLIPGHEGTAFDSAAEAAAHYVKRYVDNIVRHDTFLNRLQARLWIWRNLRT